MARDYAKVAPQFWTGRTGRMLRQDGPEVQLAALYLLTSPHANALGLYYIPLPLLAHESGIPLARASEALAKLCERGFCAYDAESETVWVHEMARYQLGESMKASDNLCKWVRGLFDSLPNTPLRKDFLCRYGAAYHLPHEASESPSEALAKPSATGAEAIETREKREERREIQEHTQGTTVNEDRARAEACAGVCFGEGLRPVNGEDEEESRAEVADGHAAADVSMEFLELRELYDRLMRPEAPMTGLREYRQLRAGRQWPGMAKMADAISVWSDFQGGPSRFSRGLVRFLAEGWWMRQPGEQDRTQHAAQSAATPVGGSIRPGAAEIDARIAAARAEAR